MTKQEEDKKLDDQIRYWGRVARALGDTIKSVREMKKIEEKLR